MKVQKGTFRVRRAAMGKKIKAVDIARALDLSKATVSLALNGKPGVSDKTRKQILEYKEKAEKGLLPMQETHPVEYSGNHSDLFTGTDMNAHEQRGALTSEDKKVGRQIAVLMVSGGMKNIKNNELDLWTDVKIVLEKDFRDHGYSMVLIYADLDDKPDFMSAIRKCNDPGIEGVMVDATELREGQTRLFEGIHKPILFYDYAENNENYSFVSINNRQGVRIAVDELMDKGNRDILYLGMTMPMYNYESRRRGFVDAMVKYGYSREEAEERIVPCADSILGARDFMLDYLENHRLPEAFLCDSYHESIGLLDALARKEIRVPEDVSVIGIDTLPEYITHGIHFTSVRVSHTARGKWAAETMYREIQEPSGDKILLYVNCSLVPGETVADRTGTGS